MSHWEKCPKCGQPGKIDDDQLAGRVSIRCVCGHHYYRHFGTQNGAEGITMNGDGDTGDGIWAAPQMSKATWDTLLAFLDYVENSLASEKIKTQTKILVQSYLAKIYDEAQAEAN